jgi:phage terminase large subunit
VFSEWALSNPQAWSLIRPILLENNGWALFITTPRGRNHAHRMFEMANKRDGMVCRAPGSHRDRRVRRRGACERESAS